MKRAWQSLPLLLGIAWVCEAQAQLRVVGSDFLGLDFSRAFYAHAGRAGVAAVLAFDGSRRGWEEVKSGRADLALVILPAETVAETRGLSIGVVAYHAVVVLVPANCPLEHVTMPQLAALFGAPASAGGGGSVARWGDLEAKGDWGARVLVPVVPDAASGLTAECFRSVVLRGGPWKSSVQRYATRIELAGHIRGESPALALAAAVPPDQPALKTLPVAAGPRQPGVHATADTLAAETYPLRSPLRVVFRIEKLATVAPLLEFLFSEEAARALAAAEIVALPPAARAGRLRALHAAPGSPASAERP